MAEAQRPGATAPKASDSKLGSSATDSPGGKSGASIDAGPPNGGCTDRPRAQPSFHDNGSEPITVPIKSKNRIVKDGRGDRKNFQLSYGLSLAPGGYREGTKILEAFQDSDRQAAAEQDGKFSDN